MGYPYPDNYKETLKNEVIDRGRKCINPDREIEKGGYIQKNKFIEKWGGDGFLIGLTLNPKLSFDNLIVLMRSETEIVKKNATANLKHRMPDYDKSLEEAETSNDKTKLDELAKSKIPFIREAVSLNPSTSASTLQYLVTDPDENVRKAAIQGVENKEMQVRIEKLKKYEAQEQDCNDLLTDQNAYGNDCGPITETIKDIGDEAR